MRDLDANVAPRTERRAGSQTHKSRRGLGESRYRETLGDPGGPWDNPASRVTGELTALVGACDGGTPPSCSCGAIHRAGGALSILRFGGRDGIRTHDLLIANSGENKLRRVAT